MKYNRFEELPVWQAAIKLAVEIYNLTANEAFRGQRSLRDQIERAAVSVSNNIAEGFERGTNNELLMFLYIARGSAGEVRSMLCLLERLPAFAKSTAPQQAAGFAMVVAIGELSQQAAGNIPRRDLKFQISNFKLEAENISRQLRAWADSRQNSEIKGQRYLTDKTRRVAKARSEREEFLAELRRVQEEVSVPRVKNTGDE